MAFQTREFVSIVAGMINRMRATQTQVTDFNVGGVARALLEAPAIEIEQLYIQYVNGLLDAIPAAVYRGFGFARLPAAFAAGPVVFTGADGRQSDVEIPAGTLVLVPGTTKVYATDEDATLAVADESVTVRVTATTAGAAGNALPLSITGLQASMSGIAAVSNPAALTSGLDEETDGDRQARFILYLESLAAGTRGALEYAALSSRVLNAGGEITEYIARVGLDETLPGRVDVWVYGSGGAVSDSLLARVQQAIDGYEDGLGGKVAGKRSAGIQVRVRRMGLLPVNVSLVVRTQPGFALNAGMQASLAAAVDGYLASVEPGGYVLVSLLISNVLQVSGVESVDLLAPASNVAVPVHSIPVIGTLTVA